MERRNFLKLGTGAALGGALAACGGGGGTAPPPPSTEPVRNSVALGWNLVANAAVRATGTSPPIAARALAIVHTAMYDAWTAYDGVAQSTRSLGQLRRPPEEHALDNQRKAFSFAAYATLLDLFPTQKAAFDLHMGTLGYWQGQASLDAASPHGLGTLAARKVLEHAWHDGANQLGNLTPGGQPYADYSGYAARNAPLVVAAPTPRSAIARPDLWQPLTYRNAAGTLVTPPFLLPFWGKVRPFAIGDGAQFRPGPPAQFGTAEFVDQAHALVDIQVALTDEHLAMANYWAGAANGDLPTTQWCSFAQAISARDRHTEAQDVLLLFALSNALFDASIAAWDTKRAYDSARPISAIRYLLCGQQIRGFGFDGPAGGLRQIAGEAWMPCHLPTFPTPPFPDHVSGHSTLSAASASVLRLFTGSDTFNHSHAVAARSLAFNPALPAAALTLRWPTFTYAACEAGTSRIYSGIHFHNADVAGRALGEAVGSRVYDKARCYWLGQVPT